MATKSISELFNLNGKCGVVIGVATRIGEAISLRLAGVGTDVMIVDSGVSCKPNCR